MSGLPALAAHCPHELRRPPSTSPNATPDEHAFCVALGRIAIGSLYDELSLYPKPGLVSLVDNGSHADMTADTFMRSMFSLRHYFLQMAEAGLRRHPFHMLKRLGIEAEKRMLLATGGINTHRGAIFAVGLLCAAAGRCWSRRGIMSPHAIRSALAAEWGDDLARHACAIGSNSHGTQVARRYAAAGAREEAALAMPSVFAVALPALETTLARTGSWELARIEALFALMACMSDTNVYYRGGDAGARMVKTCARDFLERGGTSAPDWKEYAIRCHLRFTQARLSPGGAADLLGAACFVHRTVRHFGTRLAALPRAEK